MKFKLCMHICIQTHVYHILLGRYLIVWCHVTFFRHHFFYFTLTSLSIFIDFPLTSLFPIFPIMSLLSYSSIYGFPKPYTSIGPI